MPQKELILPTPYSDLSSVIQLSNREIECLSWAAHGKSAHEIGIILGITTKTVTFHWDNIRRKLNVVNMQQATAKAVAMKLITV